MKKRFAFIAAALGAVLTVAGLFLSQQTAVWTKAVKICLECVGIG